MATWASRLKLPAESLSRPSYGPSAGNGPANTRGRGGLRRGGGRGEAAKRMIHGKKKG